MAAILAELRPFLCVLSFLNCGSHLEKGWIQKAFWLWMTYLFIFLTVQIHERPRAHILALTLLSLHLQRWAVQKY